MRKTILLAITAAGALAVPANVSAQRLPATVVAVVDTSKIYSECTACTAARTQLQSQATALQTRQKTLTDQLRPEQQQLSTAVNALNGKQPDAALQARIKAFQDKEQSANQELQQGQQRLQSTQANILRQINERMNPIINQAMTARGANIAMDVDATLAHAATVNITADVLARLNAALPSVSATPLPQQQQQQPQGR
jgi:Skp family chaperone for outer membrane proteins